MVSRRSDQIRALARKISQLYRYKGDGSSCILRISRAWSRLALMLRRALLEVYRHTLLLLEMVRGRSLLDHLGILERAHHFIAIQFRALSGSTIVIVRDIIFIFVESSPRLVL
ncbi:hypothetical protein CK203_060577 [Vitis vinifera]|uniref:Uncharacterized protein n=1 Tax=Vitis vinifera TaxID=29760 RepID=A0A438FTT6_VITVI|nr:hypothetical protein CK203_060577 [Vitis vinifera]